MEQTNDGGYIIVGYTENFGVGSYDIYLIKTNSSGDILWTKVYGGYSVEYGFSIQQTLDNGFIITGGTYSFGLGSYDVLLFKTDVNGNIQWEKTYGGNNLEAGVSVQQNSDGGYIITGYSNSFSSGDFDVFIIRTDSSGALLWSKTIGGINDDYGLSVQETSDNGYIITGEIENTACLIKMNAVGATEWTSLYSGNGTNRGNYVRQTFDGGYIIAAISYSLYSNYSVFHLIKTDSNGQLASCNQNSTTNIINTPSTQITTPSLIVSSTNTMVSNLPLTVYSGGAVETICQNNGLQTNFQNSQPIMSIFPNPTSSTFTVTIPLSMINSELFIYNSLGEIIFSIQLLAEQTTIELKDKLKGIYFIEILSGDEKIVRKLLVD